MKNIMIVFKSGQVITDSCRRVVVTQLTLHYTSQEGAKYTYRLSEINHFEVE